MNTNDIKKGMRIRLACGWYGTMWDNRKGNIRMAEVEGIFTEIGSVYAHDIVAVQPEKNGAWVSVEHDEKQKKLKQEVDRMFGG